VQFRNLTQEELDDARKKLTHHMQLSYERQLFTPGFGVFDGACPHTFMVKHAIGDIAFESCEICSYWRFVP
jgi:hypothetical protein